MASRICCANNHATKAVSTWEAAVAVSQGQPVGLCKKCGKELQYRMEHVYASDSNPKENRFVVTTALRRGPQMCGGESFDPFLLVLRDLDTGAEKVLPMYWSYGRDKPSRGGPFPPLLSLREWKSLFSALDASFETLEERIRLRAYELYEERGRAPGHALDDWLRAEAESSAWEGLRAAA